MTLDTETLRDDLYLWMFLSETTTLFLGLVFGVFVDVFVDVFCPKLAFQQCMATVLVSLSLKYIYVYVLIEHNLTAPGSHSQPPIQPPAHYTRTLELFGGHANRKCKCLPLSEDGARNPKNFPVHNLVTI